MTRIAILASGGGTNAQAIMEHFSEPSDGQVVLVISNKADAYVLKRAENMGVPWLWLPSADLRNGEVLLKILAGHRIDFIVLAGYLLLIPSEVVQNYPSKIVNIHPALLPSYGGKGMFGTHVHKAVISDGQRESGITIHYVNEQYDEGDIIFQATCPVHSDDTPESLAERIHLLEHNHYPVIIRQLIRK